MAVVTKTKIDSWKRKKWYKVISPRFLGESELAQVPATDDDHLMNRVIKLPLREITRDLNHTYTNIYLRVFEIVGGKAFTKFIKHETAREYLGTLVRRRRDALQVVFPAKSADGVEFTVKLMVVTTEKCSNKQKTALRHAARKFVFEKVAKQAFGEFILDTLYGKTSAESVNAIRKIAVPIKTVEIYKTQLKELFDTEEVIKQDNAEEPVKEEAKPKVEETAAPVEEKVEAETDD
ncbi:MAG: hypothetical protein WC607_00250 [Candidatus Micrarchaeia archaeon]